MNLQNNKRIFIAYGALVFMGLFIFLSFINPLTVYDTDDWLYIYELRKPIPMLHAWNPTRIFPETFMPLVSYFGALFIKPLIKNYFFSLTVAHALFGSLIITLYFVEFLFLLYKKKNASSKALIGYGALFILLHFIALINHGKDNSMLLLSINLTCFYYYTLSALLNAALVMHFMAHGGVKNLFGRVSLLHKLLVVIWGYFAINSNLYSSVVLATYVGTELLLSLISDIREKRFRLKDYFLDNWISLFIILSWFVVNYLETRGGRAGSFGNSFVSNLLVSIGTQLYGIVSANIFVTVLIVVVAVIWRNKQETKRPAALKFKLYVAFSLVYLIMLSAVVDTSYVARQEVLLCNYFYVLLAFVTCLYEIVTIDRKYLRTLFILLGTVVLLFIMPGRLYRNYNYSNISYDQCEALMNDIIDQFKSAEQNGEKEITLVVPKFDDEGNWPLFKEAGERFANALYKHKVLDTYITVTEMVLSEEANEKFGIDPQ